MGKKIISAVLILTFLAAVTGCQTIPEEHKGAAVGAGAGAAAGTIAGAAIGKSTKAAVIGGLVGALLGGAIGHYAYDEKKSREETAQTYQYSETKGSMLILEDASLSSQTAKPGDLVEITMTYAVLNPSPGARSTITEVREIRHDEELVGRPEVRVERSDGTFTSTVPINLPATAKKGVYRVIATVQTESNKDTKELSFTVI